MQEYNKKLYEYSPAKMFSYQTIEQSYMEKMKNIYKNQGLKILLKQMMKKMLSPIIITNSAIWFEKDLTEELTDYKLKFPVEVDTSSIDKTINWLKNQKESWVVNQEEITTAYKYNH
jgi:hypothetical protein